MCESDEVDRIIIPPEMAKKIVDQRKMRIMPSSFAPVMSRSRMNFCAPAAAIASITVILPPASSQMAK